MQHFKWLCLRFSGSSGELGLSPALKALAFAQRNQIAGQKLEIKISRFPFGRPKAAPFKEMVPSS